MSRREIRRKFDAIVDFSGVGRFIDTPVKHYSSGMHVRLAFAVAAHLDPEILMIDEVLSVGDAGFQRKCLGKMQQVTRSEGRTVLFVSHNMAAVRHLCDQTVVLQHGQVVFYGDTNDAVEVYLRTLEHDDEDADLETHPVRTGDGRIVITSFGLRDHAGRPISQAVTGQEVTIVLGYKCNTTEVLRDVIPSFVICDQYGSSLILHRSNFTGQHFHDVSGRGEFRCTIPRLPLTANTYRLYGGLYINKDAADDLLVGEMRVVEGDYFGTGSGGMPSHSPVLIDGKWTCSDARAA